MSGRLEPSQPDLPVDSAALWRAICEEESLYVWVIDEDATIRYVNRQAARFYLGKTPDQVIGQPLHELFPQTFSRQRLRLARAVIDSDQPIRFPTHWAGSWLHASVWPVQQPRRGVLVLVRPAFQQSLDADLPLLSLWEGNDHQPLAALSATERLVLAGIGEGWSTAEIAQRMHRSMKTVEWHRLALGRRLGCKTRVELARIALLAGLSWDQALAMCGGRYAEKT